MSQPEWKRVEELFHAACDINPGPRRDQFLQEACAGDNALLEEVRSLLASETGSGLFAQAIGEVALSLSSDPKLPERIGVYRIERKLGQGGMGTVYLATRDDDQYRKQVALKVIRRGMDSPLLIDRFRYERQILATLEHPHIARLLDGGSTAEGLPYLVMEFVEGEPLTSYCASREMDLPSRLRLFQEVCGAVAHAHRKLIIHRDLKPSNILVTTDGSPRLLDFGTAKLLSPEFDSDQRATRTGERMLTPDYASPEQLRGEPVSTASDVYSLGVILYELLSGKRPYETQGNPMVALERIVTGTEPAPPSDATTSESRIRRLLKGDLDQIVLKTLRKEPERRYASVEQLAEDIGRYLDGRPVLAGPDTLAYRASKFVRRNKFAVAAFGAGLLALIAGTGVALWQAQRAREAAARAEQRFADVRALANTFLFDTQEKLRTIPGTLAVRKSLVDTAQQHLAKLAKDSDGDPQLQFELAIAYDRLGRILGNPSEVNFGNTEQALASSKQALTLFEKALAASPANEKWLIGASEGHRHYAELVNQNHTKDAIVAMGKAVEFARRAVEIGQSKERYDALRSALARLAEFQRSSGDGADAIRSGDEAVAVARRLLHDFPGNYAKRSLAIALCAAGTSKRLAEQYDAAQKDLNACKDLREELLASGKSTVADRRNLGLVYLEIAGLQSLTHAEDPMTAIRSAEKALETLRGTASDREDARAVADESAAQVRLGNLWKKLDVEKAIGHLAEAVRLRAAAGDPDNAALSRLSSSRNDLAELLLQQKQDQAAKAQLDQALALNKRVLDKDPDRTFYLEAAARTHKLLADFHSKSKQWKDALASCQAAIAVAERLNSLAKAASSRIRLADAYSTCGRISKSSGDLAKATASYRKGIAVWPSEQDAATPAEKRSRERAAKALFVLKD